MATEQDAARDRVLAARADVDEQLQVLEASTRAALDIKAKIRKAAKDSGDWTTSTQAADDLTIMASLPKWNISAVKPSDEDMKKAIGGIAPYWEQWAKSRGPQFVEILGKLRAALNR